jgi:hypothetical protein
MGAVKRPVSKLARRLGYDIRRVASRDELQWRANALRVIERRKAQTLEESQALAAKYRAPVFGPVRVWDLVERQALCIDELDERLGLVSQLVHSLQVAEGLVADGLDDSDLLVAALIHDVGKLLLLVGEDIANVAGTTRVMVGPEPGIGLDGCVMQWGHDEVAYSRFKDHVPDHVAWLLRYHSVDLDECRPFLDERDTRYAEQYLTPFRRCEARTKSMVHLPVPRHTDYRDLIEDAFPQPVLF